jgi:hypothetical protein
MRIKRTIHQIGKSDLHADLLRNAMKPGRRITKKGHIYYEYRKNRTDMPGKKV